MSIFRRKKTNEEKPTYHFEGGVHVKRVANGYVVNNYSDYSAKSSESIAKDLEEVREVLKNIFEKI